MQKKLELSLNAALLDIIHKEIDHQGIISFARYMELALYTNRLGYYSSDLKKFGKQGDFVTAPEISPLFTQCLAKQIQEIINAIKEADILEFGAGSGKMAMDLLTELEKLGCLPRHYYILELSASLKERQKILFEKEIPKLLHRIQWLEHLPSSGFKGAIIANEVIDAMPVHKFNIKFIPDGLPRAQSNGGLSRGRSAALQLDQARGFIPRAKSNQLNEIYVAKKNGEFIWQEDKASTPELKQRINAVADILMNYQAAGYDLPDKYESEINLLLPGWLNALNQCINQAVVILLDYGYPRHEYYHPQRSMGTLMCHYQHRVHSDPLILTGLQDITAHVDFSLLAESAMAAGFTVSGYTDQAHFLFNCGLMDLLNSNNIHTAEKLAVNQQVKLLTLPSEMGELIKVMALNKNIELSPLGFQHNDKRVKL